MTQTKNQPAATLRSGAIKAVIWRNPGKEDRPPIYSVNFVRSYTDANGNWHDTTSFSEADSLRIGYLIPKVVATVTDLVTLDKQTLAER